MKDFVAIDFETANGSRSSVCSVGIVIVRDGEIVDRLYRLIRPEPNYYNFYCTRVHGMTERDTNNALTFPEVWREIAPLIHGLPLVAHNAPFDEGCLRTVHECYGMCYPEYLFFDTLKVSRKLFGKELPNHQLQTVATRCGFCLDNHHNALADAVACAEIAMKIL